MKKKKKMKMPFFHFSMHVISGCIYKYMTTGYSIFVSFMSITLLVQ